MVPETLAALATAGATTVVGAMATDAWNAAKNGIVGLFGRAGLREQQVVETQLERHARQVASAVDMDATRRRLAAAWEVELESLLASDPDIVEELRTLITSIQDQLPQGQRTWVQTNIARDHGHVFAVQGGTWWYISSRQARPLAGLGLSRRRVNRLSQANAHSWALGTPTSVTQVVRVETGYGYGVINADLHVFQDRGPVYLLTEYRPTPVPLPAGLPAQPSRLLNARFRVVAFTGREQELAELSRWRDVQGLRLSVRWLHGPGGAGKTRLAAELADASVVKGWKVVTAVHGPGSIQLPPGSQDMRTDNAAGLLLVVDYADRWPLSHLTWLMSNAMLHRDVPTRVLLLARSAYPWPAVRAAFSELAADCSDQLHGPLPGHAAPAVRHHMFAAARDAFAARYGLADPSRIAPPPELGHPDFGLTLNVHMAALVAVDARARGDTVAADPVALTVYLLDREHRHWTQLYQNRVEGTEHDTPPSVMARLVFTAALTGPMGHGGGAQLLRALDLPGHPDRLLQTIAPATRRKSPAPSWSPCTRTDSPRTSWRWRCRVTRSLDTHPLLGPPRTP
ncbi:ATP-binding protein [Dactylosporangium darangshiense]|uniref:ATP-binding protein n=1 Tax=Dactylosporangium darangshiense TaxID=579108 RepID=UPI00363A3294